jgi:hypothetical protein
LTIISSRVRRRFTSFHGTVRLGLGALLFSASLAAQQPAQADPPRGGIDWLFVIDTSASMKGAGGAQNIFDEVKSAVGEFITNALKGDSVTIYNFDRDTQTRPTVRVFDDADRRDLMGTVKILQANGDRTHTGKAIADALRRAGELGTHEDAASRKVGIVLLTDGLEDVRGIPNPVAIPSSVALIPDNRPYMFFVSLGATKETAVEAAFRQNPRLSAFQTLERPTKGSLLKLNEQIRPILEQAARRVPAQIHISVSPAVLDFGQTEPGRETSSRTIQIGSNHPVRVRLSSSGVSDVTIVDPSEAIDVKADVPVDVAVRLAVAPGVPNGQRSLRISLEAIEPGADTVASATFAELQLMIHRQPPWQKGLRWIAILLLPLVLVVAAYSVIKGQGPWVLWRSWRERDHLEGEIEIIRPRPSPLEEGRVSLSAMRCQRTSIGALISSGSLFDSDADLFTTLKNSTKRVRVQRTRGTVRVNGVEAAVADLYDGFLVEFGDAKVRFNWVGHEEPVGDHPEE